MLEVCGVRTPERKGFAAAAAAAAAAGAPHAAPRGFQLELLLPQVSIHPTSSAFCITAEAAVAAAREQQQQQQQKSSSSSSKRAAAAAATERQQQQQQFCVCVDLGLGKMSDHELSEGEREGPQELSSPQAVEKLKAAAEIANAALRQVLARVVPGADVFELCLFGDLFVAKEAAKVYQRKAKAKKIEKGIAVPTCVSVNEMFANFSPCDRSASLLLREGDLVKVHLGAHIDGFVAAAAYSVICCSSNAAAFSSGASPAAAAAAQEAAAALQETLAALPPAPEEYRQQQQQLRDAAAAAAAAAAGPAAAVLKACWLAAEAALRKVDVGAKASEVTKAIEAVAEDMGVKPMHSCR
ncbi:proliferation-associated protein 2g4, putative [Eimeria tenella]|uniref:Proliferation-associated protein 2g4, putative n=1 Tax=Eimeria tenella TaxID=5802 RepID=U6L0M0_EIMTE|nr:proliferation-associated protein 2g4, putative [Eimeria tenella]CDJ42134.1 proliferation-associated protein 2g4, putative [Eimeria tenella]|eukprot:XP_013232884.1 proliferation-associated protein 2g4, putative [Eimeria tenella]